MEVRLYEILWLETHQHQALHNKIKPTKMNNYLQHICLYKLAVAIPDAEHQHGQY